MCAANTYKVSSGSAACTQCPANSFTQATGAIARGQCLCGLGFTGDLSSGSNNCTACPLNTYKDIAGTPSCTACPANMITVVTASSDISQCVCAPGYTGPNGGPCSPCPINAYKDVSGNVSCVASNATGALTGCLCNAGFIGPNGGPCGSCVGVCSQYALCAGGSTCGGCASGFSGNGTTCVPFQSKIATVKASTSAGGTASTPDTPCAGLAYSSATCTQCANLGAGTVLTGITNSTCLDQGSPCCNFPVFYMQSAPSAQATALMYPFMEFNLGVSERRWRRTFVLGWGLGLGGGGSSLRGCS